MQKRRLHIILILLMTAMATFAQQLEYWLDSDYSHRQTRTYQGGDISLSQDMSRLSPGIHYFNIRTQDAHGVWSSVKRYLLVAPGMASETNMLRWESWLDDDYERRTSRNHHGGDIIDSANVDGLQPGMHYYNIRACDAHGVWSPISRYLFLLTDVVRPARIRYWIDSDTIASAEQPIGGESIDLTISIANQAAGRHAFNCQIQGSNGTWTPTYTYDFTIAQQRDTLSHEPTTAEYFFDSDPGYGKGIPLHEVHNDTLHLALSVEGLTAGPHILYVRAADNGGQWSATVAHPLFVSPVAHRQFERMEYFFDDADPGFGKAMPLADFSPDMDSLVSQLHSEALLPGSHTVSIRGLQADGLWTSATTRPFLIIGHDPLQPFVEYFFDTDPGFGKGTAIKDIGKGTHHLLIDLGQLSPGGHVLYVRSRDDKGHWSPTACRPLFVCKRKALTAIEYFFDDADPGFGKAFVIAIPANDAETITFELNTSHLTLGPHVLKVRALGTNGLWTPLCTETFTIIGSSKVDSIETDEAAEAVYTISGYKSNRSATGLTIIRYKDGKTLKKVRPAAK